MLRTYLWAVPTLSLGRNEPARGRFDPEALGRRGVDLVRRPTGGRAVLHHRELTYSVVVPVRSLGSIRETYVLLNRALGRGLASLGVPAEIARGADAGPALRPDAGPCFRSPAPGELVAGGRKLVGSAQARLGRAFLQHGSILVGDDQGVVAELDGSAGTGADGSGRPATLESLLDGAVPTWDALRDAVEAGVRAEVGGTWSDEPAPVDPAEQARLEETYGSRAWTWRK